MDWFKNKKRRNSIGSFRNPKIYTTTTRTSDQGFYISPTMVMVFFIIAAIGVLVWFLFASSYFKVKNIIVEGSVNPDVQQEIENLKGQNILILTLGNTDQRLAEKQSSIKEIKIYRGIPDTLKIKVTVRQPVLVWKSQEKVYLISDEGVAFEQGEGTVVNEEGQQIPTINDSRNLEVVPGNQLVIDDFVGFVSDLISSFQPKIEANITELKIGETTFQIEAQTDKGYYVLFDTTRKAESQLIALKKILDNYSNDIHEYVDLRVEGRAYYK